jgi:hypothetical protein
VALEVLFVTRFFTVANSTYVKMASLHALKIFCGLNFHFPTTLRIHFLSLLEEWGEGTWDIRLQENLQIFFF